MSDCSYTFGCMVQKSTGQELRCEPQAVRAACGSASHPEDPSEFISGAQVAAHNNHQSAAA